MVVVLSPLKPSSFDNAELPRVLAVGGGHGEGGGEGGGGGGGGGSGGGGGGEDGGSGGEGGAGGIGTTPAAATHLWMSVPPSAPNPHTAGEVGQSGPVCRQQAPCVPQKLHMPRARRMPLPPQGAPTGVPQQTWLRLLTGGGEGGDGEVDTWATTHICESVPPSAPNPHSAGECGQPGDVCRQQAPAVPQKLQKASCAKP